jgi:hypothetical protein
MHDNLRWNVPRDLWVLQRQARRRRTVRAWIPGEPQRKGRGGKRAAAAFQRAVIDRMKQRRPFSGPIALDLHFVALRKNPPSIHQLAKYALDVLGAAEPENTGPGRRSVLYYDDRQVKLLYVDLDQGWQRKPLIEFGNLYEPTTFMIARRTRDAMADLASAYPLRGQREEDFPPPGQYFSPEDTDLFTYPEASEDFDLRPLPRFSSIDEELTAFLDERNRFDAIRSRQEYLLGSADASFAIELASRMYEASVPGGLGTFGERFREQRWPGLGILSGLVTVPLSGLPQSAGAAAEFEHSIRRQLQAFKERNAIFRSLLVPLKITFVVVPSRQGKDLDNIALTALPIAHEILKPHIEPFLLAPTYKNSEPDPWRVEALARLRSLNAYSVRAYQVIELPRISSDPPEGQLRLSLGLHSGWSLWDRAAEHVDQAVKRYRQDRPWGLSAWDL